MASIKSYNRGYNNIYTIYGFPKCYSRVQLVPFTYTIEDYTTLHKTGFH